jgi:hypothetical protein
MPSYGPGDPSPRGTTGLQARRWTLVGFWGGLAIVGVYLLILIIGLGVGALSDR